MYSCFLKQQKVTYYLDMAHYHLFQILAQEISKEIAHYQALIWRSATENREIPEPDNYGWKRTELGNLVIDWITRDILPLELVDIISDDTNEAGSESDLDDSAIVKISCLIQILILIGFLNLMINLFKSIYTPKYLYILHKKDFYL